MCRSCAFHVPNLSISCAFMCISCAFHVHSCAFMCIPNAFMCISFAFHMHACALHVPFMCLMGGFHVPFVCFSFPFSVHFTVILRQVPSAQVYDEQEIAFVSCPFATPQELLFLDYISDHNSINSCLLGKFGVDPRPGKYAATFCLPRFFLSLLL